MLKGAENQYQPDSQRFYQNHEDEIKSVLDSIREFVRIRPENEKEEIKEGEPTLRAIDKELEVYEQVTKPFREAAERIKKGGEEARQAVIDINNMLKQARALTDNDQYRIEKNLPVDLRCEALKIIISNLRDHRRTELFLSDAPFMGVTTNPEDPNLTNKHFNEVLTQFLTDLLIRRKHQILHKVLGKLQDYEKLGQENTMEISGFQDIGPYNIDQFIEKLRINEKAMNYIICDLAQSNGLDWQFTDEGRIQMAGVEKSVSYKMPMGYTRVPERNLEKPDDLGHKKIALMEATIASQLAKLEGEYSKEFNLPEFFNHIRKVRELQEEIFSKGNMIKDQHAFYEIFKKDDSSGRDFYKIDPELLQLIRKDTFVPDDSLKGSSEMLELLKKYKKYINVIDTVFFFTKEELEGSSPVEGFSHQGEDYTLSKICNKNRDIVNKLQKIIPGIGPGGEEDLLNEEDILWSANILSRDTRDMTYTTRGEFYHKSLNVSEGLEEEEKFIISVDFKDIGVEQLGSFEELFQRMFYHIEDYNKEHGEDMDVLSDELRDMFMETGDPVTKLLRENRSELIQSLKDEYDVDFSSNEVGSYVGGDEIYLSFGERLLEEIGFKYLNKVMPDELMVISLEDIEDISEADKVARVKSDVHKELITLFNQIYEYEDIQRSKEDQRNRIYDAEVVRNHLPGFVLDELKKRNLLEGKITKEDLITISDSIYSRFTPNIINSRKEEVVRSIIEDRKAFYRDAGRKAAMFLIKDLGKNNIDSEEGDKEKIISIKDFVNNRASVSRFKVSRKAPISQEGLAEEMDDEKSHELALHKNKLVFLEHYRGIEDGADYAKKVEELMRVALRQQKEMQKGTEGKPFPVEKPNGSTTERNLVTMTQDFFDRSGLSEFHITYNPNDEDSPHRICVTMSKHNRAGVTVDQYADIPDMQVIGSEELGGELDKLNRSAPRFGNNEILRNLIEEIFPPKEIEEVA